MLDTDRVREEFLRDGVVHLPGFLNRAEIDELDANLARYIADVVPTVPPTDAFYEVVGDRRALGAI